jgi:hypothetical protein
MVLQVCTEKLNRMPSECGHILMNEIWETILLNQEESDSG